MLHHTTSLNTNFSINDLYFRDLHLSLVRNLFHNDSCRLLSIYQLSIIRTSRFFIIASFVLGFFCKDISAQEVNIGIPPITNFTRSEYKAGTQNWEIRQSEEGIIFIGNNKGLLRYEGHSWNLFRLPNATIIRSFNIDNQNKLFLGGQNEIGFLESTDFTRENYVSLTHLIAEKNLDFEDVWKTFIIDSTVYFCSEKAIFIYNGDSCSTIEPLGGRFENYFEVDGSLFFQDISRGLYKYEAGELIKVGGNGVFESDRIASILPFDHGGFLAITVSSGYFIVQEGAVSKWDRSDYLNGFIEKPYCAIKLVNGNYAVGSSQNGLTLFNKSGQILTQLNVDRGLQNNTVLSIYEDKQNNLWLGLDNGIDYVEINSPLSFIGSEMGINGTGYAARVFEENLYLGTNQGLFKLPWSVDLDYGKLKFNAVKEVEGQVWGLDEINGNLIVDQHAGANAIAGSDLKGITNIQGVWKSAVLLSDSEYVIQGAYTGFYLFGVDYKNNAGWESLGRIDGFDESARLFEEDDDGNIWVSHAYRGLYKLTLDKNLKKFQSITSYGKAKGLPSDIFTSVSKIRNQLTFSTLNGIYNYDQQRDTFLLNENLTELIGEGKNVNQIIEDDLGRIWISMENEFGLIKVKEQGLSNELEIFYLNQLEDALVDGYEYVYSYDAENSFIAIEDGFVHFNPSSISKPEIPFNLILESINIALDDDSIVNVKSRFDGAVNPEFQSNMNNFNFSFVTPHFEKFNEIAYRYKLAGFDENWSGWYNKTTKEYSNLPAGDYAFTVEAKNVYGALSKSVSVSFRILPPWYRSTIAKGIYIILIISSLVFYWRYISFREKKKTETFKQEQNAHLKEKEAEFQKSVEENESEIMELKNKNLKSEIAFKNSELASATMHLVQKGEILMKIKSDLSEIAKKVPENLTADIKRIERKIEADVRLDKNWERFEKHFDQVHQNFFKRLRANHTDLTPKDQKLSAYLRMNLTTKEIAPLLNISVRGVEISRYRLRKKLNLESDTNLVSFIMEV